MEDWVYQIQCILANELDNYKRQGNQYIDNNIQEIQELYKDKEQKKEDGKVEDKEVILIKLYKVFISTSITESSFIQDEVENLTKYMKFIHSPMQIWLFKPSPNYLLLKSRGKKDPEFWKEVATVLVKNKYNIEISQNGYSITIYQRRPPHKLYFIVIDNRRQVIIGSNKKMVVTYMVKKLEVLI